MGGGWWAAVEEGSAFLFGSFFFLTSRGISFSHFCRVFSRRKRPSALQVRLNPSPFSFNIIHECCVDLISSHSSRLHSSFSFDCCSGFHKILNWPPFCQCIASALRVLRRSQQISRPHGLTLFRSLAQNMKRPPSLPLSLRMSHSEHTHTDITYECTQFRTELFCETNFHRKTAFD